MFFLCMARLSQTHTTNDLICHVQSNKFIALRGARAFHGLSSILHRAPNNQCHSTKRRAWLPPKSQPQTATCNKKPHSNREKYQRLLKMGEIIFFSSAESLAALLLHRQVLLALESIQSLIDALKRLFLLAL